MNREIETIKRMIEIYCRGRHGGVSLCDNCKALLDYSLQKVDKCPQNPKPKCKDCKIHCFSAEKREQIKNVMRYAGPRMLIRHPLLALKHCLR